MIRDWIRNPDDRVLVAGKDINDPKKWSSIMGQVIIPFTFKQQSQRLQTLDWNEQINSNRFPDGRFDLEGDYPTD